MREKLQTNSGIFQYILNPVSSTVNIFQCSSKFVSHTYGSCLYNILSSRQSGPYSDLPSVHISLPGAHPVFPLTFEHCISYGSSHRLFLQPPALLNTLPVLRVTSQACGVDGHSGCVSASPRSASCCVFAESRKSPGTKAHPFMWMLL